MQVFLIKYFFYLPSQGTPNSSKISQQLVSMVNLSSDHLNCKGSSGFMYSLEDYNSITATVYKPEGKRGRSSQLLWRGCQFRTRKYRAFHLVLLQPPRETQLGRYLSSKELNVCFPSLYHLQLTVLSYNKKTTESDTLLLKI